MRCFVAVDVSPEVRDAIGRAQAAVRTAASHADVRWVDPAQFHLTVKFLGQVPDAQVEAIVAALAAPARATAAIDVTAAGLGAFPTLRRPRVVWAGTTGGVEALARLARGVDAALAPLGFVPEERPFRAHVTLGRVRSSRAAGALATALARAASVPLGAWTVRDVVLYQSRLGPQGARYETIARLVLRAEKR